MIDLSSLTDEPTVNPADYALARRCSEELTRIYPGHLWGVSAENGIVRVLNIELSDRDGITIRLPLAYSAKYLTRVLMQAGGQLLEIYGVARGRTGPGQIGALQRDVAGRAKARV